MPVNTEFLSVALGRNEAHKPGTRENAVLRGVQDHLNIILFIADFNRR